MHDQIGAEFVAAVSDENGYREQIQVASEGDERARETCEMNLLKIREGEGLPLELIPAINSLVESLDAYVATVCDYNRVLPLSISVRVEMLRANLFVFRFAGCQWLDNHLKSRHCELFPRIG